METLETERLRLLPFRLADEQALFDLWNEPEVSVAPGPSGPGLARTRRKGEIRSVDESRRAVA